MPTAFSKAAPPLHPPLTPPRPQSSPTLQQLHIYINLLVSQINARHPPTPTPSDRLLLSTALTAIKASHSHRSANKAADAAWKSVLLTHQSGAEPRSIETIGHAAKVLSREADIAALESDGRAAGGLRLCRQGSGGLKQAIEVFSEMDRSTKWDEEEEEPQLSVHPEPRSRDSPRSDRTSSEILRSRYLPLLPSLSSLSPRPLTSSPSTPTPSTNSSISAALYVSPSFPPIPPTHPHTPLLQPPYSTSPKLTPSLPTPGVQTLPHPRHTHPQSPLSWPSPSNTSSPPSAHISQLTPPTRPPAPTSVISYFSGLPTPPPSPIALFASQDVELPLRTRERWERDGRLSLVERTLRWREGFGVEEEEGGEDGEGVGCGGEGG